MRPSLLHEEWLGQHFLSNPKFLKKKSNTNSRFNDSHNIITKAQVNLPTCITYHNMMAYHTNH